MEFHLDTGGMPFPQAHKALFSLQFFDWRKKKRANPNGRAEYGL